MSLAAYFPLLLLIAWLDSFLEHFLKFLQSSFKEESYVKKKKILFCQLGFIEVKFGVIFEVNFLISIWKHEGGRGIDFHWNNPSV